MSDDQARLLEWLDGQDRAAQDFLAALIRQPSDNPPGDCAPHAELTARLLAAQGWQVESHVVPQDVVRAAGLTRVTNLVVRHRFGPGPVIALNAHGDVVPPGAGWSMDPYGAEIRDGAMYGRGAAVSKSDFATYAFALAALRDAAPPARGTVELHFTYDEETGGTLGPAWLLAQGIVAPDMAICAGFTHNVVIAHNGCLHLEISVHGRSAHAARPETGADALEAATAILHALYGLRAAYAGNVSSVSGIGHPNLVVGLIEGGINTNVVPDLVRLRLDRRIIPEENPELVEQELRAAIAAVPLAPGISIEVRQVLRAAPMRPQPGQAPMIAALCRHARALLGEEIPIDGTPIYCDARHYAEAGIPTVLFGAGPRSLLEANGHRADEHLQLSDLAAATRIVALTLQELLA